MIVENQIERISSVQDCARREGQIDIRRRDVDKAVQSRWKDRSEGYE